MSEEMMKLAYEFGAGLAQREMAKAAGRYEETVDEDSPIWSRIKQHGGTGARWGGGLGALLGAGAGATMGGGRRGGGGLAGALGGAAVGGLTGLLSGGLLGGAVGSTQGSYDAGLVHALKKRENPSFDDSPTTRAMATNLFLGLNPVPGSAPLLAAALSEHGKNQGRNEPDLAGALAALRGPRRDEFA